MSASENLTDAARQALEDLMPGGHHCTDCGHRVLGVDDHGRCAVCEMFAESAEDHPARPELVVIDGGQHTPLDVQAFDAALDAFKAVYRRVFAAAAESAAYVMEREEAHQEATQEALEAAIGAYLKRSGR